MSKPIRIVSFIGAAVLVSVSAFAAESSSGGATPTPSAPTAPMQIALPAVYIAGITHSGTYASGPLSTILTVKNRGAAVASNIKVTQLRLSGGQLVPLPIIINIPPQGKVDIVFADPDGLEQACFDKTYTFELSGTGSIDTRARKATLHPTCTFAAKIANPFWTASDDVVLGQQAGKMYVEQVHFPGSITLTNATLACGKPIKIEGAVANATNKNGNPIFFGLKDPSGKTTIGSAGPLLVGAKQSTPYAITGPMTGYAGTHSFVLSDPNNSVGPALVVNQGITMNVTRSCTVDAKLEP